MYMMNYLFDFNRDTGLFSGDRTASTKKLAGLPNELYTSKNWLKFKPTATVPEPGSPFPAIFNPELEGIAAVRPGGVVNDSVSGAHFDVG